jgi:hypothetical protein
MGTGPKQSVIEAEALQPGLPEGLSWYFFQDFHGLLALNQQIPTPASQRLSPYHFAEAADLVGGRCFPKRAPFKAIAHKHQDEVIVPVQNLNRHLLVPRLKNLQR